MSPSFNDHAKRRPFPQPDTAAQAPEWRIETLAEAEQRNEKRIDQLLANGAQGIARAIARCDATDGNGCGQPGCAVCARAHRSEVIQQLRELAASRGPDCMILTAYLEHQPLGQLLQVDLRLVKESLRKRLDRYGLKGSIFAGGIEAAWQARHERWLIHAHLLAIGVDDDDWAKAGGGVCRQRSRRSRRSSSSERCRSSDLVSREVRDLSPTGEAPRQSSAACVSTSCNVGWPNSPPGGRATGSKNSCSSTEPDGEGRASSLIDDFRCAPSPHRPPRPRRPHENRNDPMRANAPIGHRNMRPVSVSNIHRVSRNPPNSRLSETPSLLRLFLFCPISPCGQGRRVANTKRRARPPTPTPRVGTLLMPLGMSPSTIEVQP